MGGQYDSACVASNEPEPVAVIVERAVVSLAALNKVGTFLGLKVFSLFLIAVVPCDFFGFEACCC